MPNILCGITCFEIPELSTADDVAQEFLASLNPALKGTACEVYRLERLDPEAELESEDVVVCRVPNWHFDFAALEDMHRQLEELVRENEELQAHYDRTKDVLISVNSAIEATEAADSALRAVTPPDASGASGPVRQRGTGPCSNSEIQQLRQQLARSEKKQHETKATVMALRTEFMQLVDLMEFTGNKNCQGFEMPTFMKEVARCPQHVSALYDSDKLEGYSGGQLRHVSQPPPSSAVATGRRGGVGSSARQRVAAGGGLGVCGPGGGGTVAGDLLRTNPRTPPPINFTNPRRAFGVPRQAPFVTPNRDCRASAQN